MKTVISVMSLAMAALLGCSKPIVDPPLVSTEEKPPVAKTLGGVITSEARPLLYLDALGSYDPGGSPLTYRWKITSGPAGAVNEDTNAARTKISGYSIGTYNVLLTVTNARQKSATSNYGIVVVANKAPWANAGPDQIVEYPDNSAELGGWGEDVSDSITNYTWKTIAEPSGGTLNSFNAGYARASNLMEGVYQFELTVNDGVGLEGKDTVLVQVNGDIPPTDSITLAGVDLQWIGGWGFGPSHYAIIKNFKQYLPQGTLLRKVALKTKSSNSWQQLFFGRGYEFQNNTDLIVNTYEEEQDIKMDILLAWR